MRTKKENPPAKEKFLDTAQRLMLSKGYTATTVDEICIEAGFTKGSFFHYFKSKEDLGRVLLDRFVSKTFEEEQNAAFFREKDPLKKIYGYIDYIIEVNNRPGHQTGCLLGNFAQVLSDTHPGIRAQCDGYFRWWAGLLKEVMEEAKTKYNLEVDFDARSLADHLIAVIEGSLILARARQDASIIEENLLHFKQYLKTIFKEA